MTDKENIFLNIKTFMMNLLNKIFSLRKKKFIQDSAILQAGSVFSISLSSLASVLYARVLGIEGYANYALIFAFVGLASIFMNVGTNQTILTLLSEAFVKEEKEKIKDILTYYIKITLLVSLIVGIIIILIAPFVTIRLYASSEIGQLARVILLSNIINVFFGMYVVILQVERKIKYLTVIENLNKIFYVTVPVAMVLLGLGLRGLVAGHLIVASCFVVFSLLAYNKLKSQNSLLPSWKELIVNMRVVKLGYYFKFGFLIAIDKNLGSLYGILPIFILGIFNLEYVAFLKIAMAYAGLSLILIGPVSRLLIIQLPKSKVYGLSFLKRDFIRSLVGSFLITFSMAFVLAIMARILIPLVYGKEYLVSVFLTYPFLAGSVITSLGVGISSMTRTLHLMKQSILINFILVSVGLLFVYYAIRYCSIMVSIYVIALWLPIATIVMVVYVFNKIRIPNNIKK